MAKTKKRRKVSIIAAVCVITLCAYFAISLISLGKNISETKSQIAVVQQEVKAQNAKNKELRDQIENGDIDGYAENIARNKLGYVMPGERVYYDVSVSD